MSTKKIWIMAIIFGAIMASIFYLVTLNKGNTNDVAINPSPISEETDETLENTGSKTNTDKNVKNPLHIGAGKRAISIAVDEIQSASGFIRPGSFVDIIAVMPSGTPDQRKSQIILENVRVLAVGKMIIGEDTETDEPYQTITLEVNPQDGVTLTLATSIGQIVLMLRGNEKER